MPPNRAANHTKTTPPKPTPPARLAPTPIPTPPARLAPTPIPTPPADQPVDRHIRCPNPHCPSAKYGRPALICIIEAPPQIPIAVRTRCRRCKSFQRIHLPPKPPPF